MKNVNLVFFAAFSLLIMSCCGNGKQASESEAACKSPSSEIVDANSGATQIGAVENPYICTIQNLDITLDEGRAKVVEFLGASSIFYFATIDGEKPRVRPIGIFTDYDGKVWFHIGKQKGMFSQIQKNNHVEIVAMHDGLWIRISGEAICEDNEAVYDIALKNTPSITSMYNEKTGLELGCIYIKNGVAEISKGTVIERFKF